MFEEAQAEKQAGLAEELQRKHPGGEPPPAVVWGLRWKEHTTVRASYSSASS